MDIKQIERCLNYFLLVKSTIDSPLPDKMDALLHGLVETYTNMKVIDALEPAVINRRSVALTFNDISEDTCYNRYRFLKPDIWRLHKTLKLVDFGDGYIRVGSPVTRLQVLPSTINMELKRRYSSYSKDMVFFKQNLQLDE